MRKPVSLKKSLNFRKRIIFIEIALVLGIAVLFFTKNWVVSLSTIAIAIAILELYSWGKAKLNESNKIKKMESVFPEFLQLMASNLRAGMTIDRALLTSSRKEFFPLDLEILQLGKELMTGKEIDRAMQDMAKRINSEKIEKTVRLIISGIRSGGNLAILLEETAINLRERNYVEKRAASNVLMYVIFIFFAVAVGAPILFGLSNVLVGIVSKIVSGLPEVQATNVPVPFTLTKITLPISFINYFSLAFLIVTNILGSLFLGLVSKGEEKEGFKYMIPLIAVSLIIFFIVKLVLGNYLSGLFG